MDKKNNVENPKTQTLIEKANQLPSEPDWIKKNAIALEARRIAQKRSNGRIIVASNGWTIHLKRG